MKNCIIHGLVTSKRYSVSGWKSDSMKHLFQNNPQSDDLLLKALQKARDGAENNLKKLNMHLQETLNSSFSSTSTKSEDTNILQSPSLVYHQTMLTINSLMNLVEDVHSQGRQSIEDIKNKQQSLNKEMFDTLQSKQKKPYSPDITAGLYQTYLAILEANAICRHLKKNIVSTLNLFNFLFEWLIHWIL